MKSFLCSYMVLFYWASQAQQKWVIESENSFINYEASHFLHDWSGANQNVKGLIIENNGVFQKIAIAMYVRDFDSKNSNRDNNALEILQVLKFPKIEFFSNEIDLEDNTLIFLGVLTFHGIELKKMITSKFKINENKLLLKGSFDLNLTDFKVPLPSFMLRKMEDEIAINYELLFQRIE